MEREGVDFIRDFSGAKLPFVEERYGFRAYRRRSSFVYLSNGKRVAYAEPCAGHFYVTDYRVPRSKMTHCSTPSDVFDLLHEGKWLQ